MQASDEAVDGGEGRIDDGEGQKESGGASRNGRSGWRWEGQGGQRDGLSWGGGDGDGAGRRDDGGQIGVRSKLGTQPQRRHNAVSQDVCDCSHL